VSHPFLDAAVQAVALFLVGVVAGTLNVIAGGGSMLALPVLIFMGLPPTVANGTNRIAILVQNVGASWSFHRRGLVEWRWLRPFVGPAVLGALVGSVAAVRIGDLAFQRILAVIMVVVAAWTLWRPGQGVGSVSNEGGVAPPKGARRRLVWLGFFVGGLWGGFIQAGVGFFVLALVAAAGQDLVRGNAVKVSMVALFSPIVLAIFIWSDKVDWSIGIALALGNLLGGLLGVHLQVLKGQRWVRGVVTAVIVVFAIRLLMGG
jgi:hypothetical protein